jgi:translation elongation factor EF-Tu-like GTPase
MLHVTAKIRLLKTAEGGRTSLVRSGYRPHFRFGELYTDGTLTFLDRQQAHPGDECEVHVTFVNPDYVRESLVVSACFDIMEGARKVGEGTILSLPAALQKQTDGARKAQQDLAHSR